MEIIVIKNLKKYFGSGENQVKALDGIDLSMERGKMTAIIGASGSGKTTLFNVIGGLYRPTEGTVIVDQHNLAELSEEQLTIFRRRKIGFIFQDYNLLDTMTLEDNIVLPMSLNGGLPKQILQKARSLAELFGLTEHLKKYPYQLSGGQKQRGAVCRALITDPKIIFADEPTGALDSKASKDLMRCLKSVNESGKATILMVTHDPLCASYAKDVYLLSDGSMKCKISQGTDRKEFYNRIIEVQSSMGGDFL